MTQIPEFSPGCFGSALGFRATDMLCRRCEFAAQCEPVHVLMKEQLREKFGIVAKKVKAPVEKKAVPVDPVAIVLPKKLQDLLDRLNNFGFDIINKLSRKVNPFDQSMPGLWVACALLTKMDMPISRDLLTTALMRKMKWQEPQARESASIAVYALLHVGAVRSLDGKISLKEVA